MSNLDIKFKRLTPFKRCVLQNFPFIEEDFDALTNYGLLCKIVKYLNDVIASQNEVQGVTEDVVTAFNNLYDYVTNYFDTLDVQEEIDNKLDEMVEDGTLEAILQKLIDQDDVINFHTLFATQYYRSSDNLYGMQGGCVLPDGTIFQVTLKAAGENPRLVKYSSDGTLLNSVEGEYGHCNGVTYNSKTNTIFITSTQDDDLGKYKVFEINPNTLALISEYDCTDKEFPAEPYGFAYIEEDDTYVWVNYWRTAGSKYIWKTDKDFNLISSKELDIEVRSTSNMGRFGDYVAVNTISDNAIMIFNPTTLDFVKEATINDVISDTWVLTEVEWFDTRNGKVYLGFIPYSATSPAMWGGGTKVYAVYDPEFNYNEIRKSNTEFSPSSEKYYVDYDSEYNPMRDGSQAAPFENLNEALNSALRHTNVTGEVQIVINNDSEDTIYPFFTMNKTYKVIRGNGSGNLQSFSGVYVGLASKVIINSGLTLTSGSTTYQNHNVVNNGNLYIDGELKMSDGSKVDIYQPAGTVTTCAFPSTGGFDCTKMYGKLVNTSTAFITDDNEAPYIIYPYSGSPTKFTSQIIGLRLILEATGTNTYTIPSVSPSTIACVRCNVPNGNSGTTTTVENSYVYGTRLYSANAMAYQDTDQSIKHLRTIFSDQGALSFQGTPTGGLSNVRVKIITTE